MNPTVKIKLSTMMFLQFFIWGAWFVTLGTFLSKNMNSSGSEIGQAFSTQSWGAIIAPFIVGLIADRFFNAEKILGLLHLSGAFLLYKMSESVGFSEFYPYVFLYMICYMPTLALVNSIAFRQMKNPTQEFSIIRLFGTLGWVVAGLCISYLFGWDTTDSIESGGLKNTFLLAGISSGVLGLFSFILPETKPSAEKNNKISLYDILGLEAIKLLYNRNFLVFFLSSVLICIPLAFYYANANPFLVDAGMENPTGKMTIGQISEIGFLLVLPWFFKKYGFKTTILAGMLAWSLRYILFAFGNAGELSWMLLLGIALHGICYDFFFVSGQIYTDSIAGKQIKSAAQGLITLATYGVGMLIGFWVSGKIVENYSGDWHSIWIFPSAFAFIILIVFLLSFKKEDILYET
ncbi:MAG: nucleoside permease [Saprospiraceae bacterium]|nr:nucleoside permease [Saprospiraceae bacterium]MBK8818518.1 nucleoside permease [Saprospiraceae bacterium]